MSLKVIVHPVAEDELRKLYKRDRRAFEIIIKAIRKYAQRESGKIRVIVAARKSGESPLLALNAGARWRIYFGIRSDVMYVVHMEARKRDYPPWIIEAARRRLRTMSQTNSFRV